MPSESTPPPQHQERQPGREHEMQPRPSVIRANYQGSGKLQDKVAIITGGDSGIGRAVAVLFAREGAKVAIAYLEEDEDAEETRRLVEGEGQSCHLFRGDLGAAAFCKQVVKDTRSAYGRIDVLVNNAAEQHVEQTFEDLSDAQWERTFRTNIHAYFYMAKAVVPYLPEGGSIINNSSVNAYKGNPKLIDYSATKGAIVSFTRSLALALAPRGIRVNGVAPGPIWTPLIPATFSAEHVGEFGSNVPLGRPGQPEEIAPCFVFLASADASYMTGQVLHPNGGTIVNG